MFGFNAGYAVMFFYIISGFLITFTLTNNYEKNPRGYARFYTNRFIRIFSVYWPVAAIAFYMFPSSLSSLLSGSPTNLLAGTFLIFSDWLVTFGKDGGQYFGFFPPGMNQSWTLGAELTFYLIAPALLRFWKPAVALLIASLLLRAFFVTFLDAAHQTQWTYTFFPSTVAFFLLGHFAMRAGSRWPVLQNPIPGAVFTVAAFVSMCFGPGASFDSARFWMAVIFFTAGLPGLFAATKKNRPLNYIGNLSYPFYLVHILVFIVAGDWIAKFVERTVGPLTGGIPVLTSVALFIVVVLIAAVATHHVVEKPLAKIMAFVANFVARFLDRARILGPKLKTKSGTL